MSNLTLIQYFEWYTPADGGHWKRLAHDAGSLSDMGFTAVWLPPAYKGTRGADSEGYDVYDIFDLGEFDQKGSVRTKYGTVEEYSHAVKTARDAGLSIYIDVVLNHMGGAEETEEFQVREVDPENRLHFTSEQYQIEAFTRFTFPGRNGRYSDFQWNKECFTGVDHAVGSDENKIYKIINHYGEDWKPLVHNEKGSFDYLILNDIETRHPGVNEEFRKWISWYYEKVPFDGVRLDAVKHMSPEFFTGWLSYIRTEINADIFAIGEYWLSDDLPVLLNYLQATGYAMSLFDAPLHHNFSKAGEQGKEYDLRKIFNDSLVGVRPQFAITFVDNHDTQPLQSLEEYTAQWFKPHAYALILLRQEGYPCVFYPDLYGTSYHGFRGDERVEVEIPALGELPLLLTMRKTRAYGHQHDYFDDPHCIGWTREGMSTDEPDGAKTGCAVLISNNPSGGYAKRMYVGERFAGTAFQDIFAPHAENVLISEAGIGHFRVNGGKIAVWVAI